MLKIRCQAHATLDSKGRLALPSPLRRALEEAGVSSLVLTYNQGAIWGWDAPTFEETVERPLRSVDPFSADSLDFVHSVIAPAQDAEIDNQGRIRVPALLRELAQLDKDAVINSVLDRVEIWDRLKWEERFRESLASAANRRGMPGKGSP